MKRNNIYRGLVLRCWLMYGGIGLIVIVGMLFSSKFVSHASQAQFHRTLLGAAGGYTLLLILLMLFTYFRLSLTVLGKLESAGALHPDQLKQAIWQRLTSFPSELFWFYWLAGFSIAQAYRLFAIGLPPWYGEEAISVWKGILFDSSTFLAFAMIHYSLLRWLLHRELKALDMVHMLQPRFHRMTSRIVIIVFCGLLYLVLRLFWYAYQGVRTGSVLQWGVFAIIAAVIIFVTLAALKLAASYLLTDMRRIEERLLQLCAGHANSIEPIAVVSPYEAGELTLAFNQLQERFSEEYTRLREEIELADYVQQKLFPPIQLQIASWKLVGNYDRQEQSSSSFFHIMSSRDQHVAIIAGMINRSGPPTSLVMSALLMLFRTQVEHNVSSELMLHRLNQQLAGVLAGAMELHIAVATLDASQAKLEWAIAGQVRIKLLVSSGKQLSMKGDNPLGSSITTSFACGSHSLDSLRQFQLDYAWQVQDGQLSKESGEHNGWRWQSLVAGQCEVNKG